MWGGGGSTEGGIFVYGHGAPGSRATCVSGTPPGPDCVLQGQQEQKQAQEKSPNRAMANTRGGDYNRSSCDIPPSFLSKTRWGGGSGRELGGGVRLGVGGGSYQGSGGGSGRGSGGRRMG